MRPLQQCLFCYTGRPVGLRSGDRLLWRGRTDVTETMRQHDSNNNRRQIAACGVKLVHRNICVTLYYEQCVPCLHGDAIYI